MNAKVQKNPLLLSAILPRPPGSRTPRVTLRQTCSQCEMSTGLIPPHHVKWNVHLFFVSWKRLQHHENRKYSSWFRKGASRSRGHSPADFHSRQRWEILNLLLKKKPPITIFRIYYWIFCFFSILHISKWLKMLCHFSRATVQPMFT